jgi:MFS family permease
LSDAPKAPTGSSTRAEFDEPRVRPQRLFAGENLQLISGIVAVILLIAFEAMAVATAMPRAVADLHGLPYYAWSFSAYLVTSLFAMVVAGSLCDDSGPRWPLIAGVCLFTAGLLVAGTAVGMGVFVAGRAIQGLGGGAVIVALYVVVARAFDESLRPRVFAAMSSAWVLPSVVGPLLAGVVADDLSWRWVFLGVAVLVVPAVLVMWPALPALDGGQPSERTGRTRNALLVAVGVAGLDYAGQRLDRWAVVIALAGVALVAAGLPRLLPAGTLRLRRGLPTSVAMRGFLAGSFFGAETFVPLMLVTHRGLSTTQAGLALTGGALGWAAGSWFQGRPSTRVRRDLLVRIGCILVIVAISGVALVLIARVPAYVAAIAWVIGGIGMGMAMATVSLLMLRFSPPEDQGVNSAALQLADSLFSVVCIGLGGAVYAFALRGSGSPVWAFWVIDAFMAAVAGFGAVAAGRLRPGGGLPA